ncbi:hypothetical protein RO3G_04990 [Rhizopus delemar RA 99-880]|uniref:Uncharacterized protein n=1 Tax=Rhizopus delemar (strain RA 99-880 / ATCC MYA-4621 / FGSC 9543 / NRRL 43880) TaxID=246409 RepID=I1BVQ5_RHIO9|nr:hypothetical protein RO3G_04990 [Rhizopus delemar RA 99-880]|eukprot:EIE80285.1 hypothetical protein RO3G_04990 [Rhizopus delemar RA 99-880]
MAHSTLKSVGYMVLGLFKRGNLPYEVFLWCKPTETEYKQLNMLVKVESAPFEDGKARHSATN